jgi:hypothetical protein
MKTKQNEYLDSLRRNPDNQFYLTLVKLLQLKLDLAKDQWVRCTDDGEGKRLQGRALELEDLIKALKRKPVVVTEHTGSFS